MNYKIEFLFKPRHFNTIELWRNVTETQWNDPLWQMQNSIKTVEQLEQVIDLTPHQRQQIQHTIDELKRQGKEPMRITPYYASLMDKDPFHPQLLEGEEGDTKLDPVFWQSVPTPANLLFPNTGLEGAMNEGSRSYGAAYQRYPNRVALFVAENTSCASYCNHCQRTKSLDTTAHLTTEEINKGLFYISHNPNIDEVLVTGGDALMISRKRLQFVLEELSKIPHLRVIRMATRVPVVLPMAITDELLQLVDEAANRFNTSGIDKYVYFMTHVNHYREITAELSQAVKRIRKQGFAIRNQTVLLNHVNTNFKTLAETFRRMFWIGIHPYYLLQCHKERGIVHFILPIQVGKIYMKHLQGWISGITKPDYAANIEGGGGKVLLMPSGHDTLNVQTGLEDRISESSATVETWDERTLYKYEALGRATPQEFEEAVEIMDRFIGRKGVFLPKVILIDEAGNHLETTNRNALPDIDKFKKTTLLQYESQPGDMPITNPYELGAELDDLFRCSELGKL
jgi:lysine 2,3-aminomutase